jgi:MFS family permease
LIGGWLLYALVYLGFAFAPGAGAIWLFYAIYGLYYGLTYGTAKALIADLVPAERRGAAYGAYNALLGTIDLPASLIAGLLWQGWGAWTGFGPSAPFLFGAALALVATAALLRWRKVLIPVAAVV